jgi:hypothetical protein
MHISEFEETLEVDRPPTSKEAARDKLRMIYRPAPYRGDKRTGKL